MTRKLDGKSILLVDDEISILEPLEKILRSRGFDVKIALSGPDGLALFDKYHFDLVISDLSMPGMDGLEFLAELKERRPDITLIIITAYGTIKTAVQAMKEGAYDFIEKPFEPLKLIGLINDIFERKKFWAMESKIYKKEGKESKGFRFENIIGYTPQMHSLFEEIKYISASDMPVLIIGENGTGKELVANAIHFRSLRKKGPCIKINCGALAENVVESELFGHEKGAFTGAVARKNGIFEMADKGTLFLDEIGELSKNIQVKLLRVLESSEFMRVGGTEILKSDFRVISATNRNLVEVVSKGDFRQDLYYRINVAVITVPPLRERRADIPLLAEFFLKRTCHDFKKNINAISRKAMGLLMNFEWPGNVRQLSNVIERSVARCKGDEILIGDLPENISNEKEKNEIIVSSPSQKLWDVEATHIANVLIIHQWNLKKAAKALNITRTTLYKKIDKYDITRPSE
ncbi:MAG: sigma-54 dependent transcriptional regulator [bacterium]|nr:sigma-54 dependent transcriptional regulator [bacterium]